MSFRILSDTAIRAIVEAGACLIYGAGVDARDGVGPSWLKDEAPRALVKYDASTETLAVHFEEAATVREFGDPDPLGCAIDFAAFVAERHVPVVVDITSLAVQSIFILTMAFSSKPINDIFALYVEPTRYNIQPDAGLIPVFSLSALLNDVKAIPGYLRAPQEELPSSLYALMGFEGGRFDRIREYYQNDESIRPVVPLPSYSAGWHLLSLKGNLGTLLGTKTAHAINRVTASNPFHALAFLQDRYGEMSQFRQMIVAPIGTKPHSLAVAVFAVQHPDVVVVYDHPVSRKDRSLGIGTIHGYDLRGLIGA